MEPEGAAESTRGRMTAPFAAFLVRAKGLFQGVCGRKEGMRIAGRESCERGRCETTALFSGRPSNGDEAKLRRVSGSRCLGRQRKSVSSRFASRERNFVLGAPA